MLRKHLPRGGLQQKVGGHGHEVPLQRSSSSSVSGGMLRSRASLVGGGMLRSTAMEARRESLQVWSLSGGFGSCGPQRALCIAPQALRRWARLFEFAVCCLASVLTAGMS